MKTRREKRRERIAELIRRIKLKEATEYIPAKASDYLYHLVEYHKQHPYMQAILYVRESACMQDYNDNGKSHERVLRRRLKKLNVHVVGRFYEVSSGWVLDSDKRQALKEAVALAKKHIKNGRETVIITTSPDRFLRHRTFHSVRNPDALPTEAEFEQLKKLTGDIPLLTLLDPDMPWKQVRGYQSKWGQKTKGNKGGRPRKIVPGYKKKQRIQKLDRVIRLYKQGRKLSDISFRTGVALNTVKDWIEKHGS